MSDGGCCGELGGGGGELEYPPEGGDPAPPALPEGGLLKAGEPASFHAHAVRESNGMLRSAATSAAALAVRCASPSQTRTPWKLRRTAGESTRGDWTEEGA